MVYPLSRLVPMFGLIAAITLSLILSGQEEEQPPQVQSEKDWIGWWIIHQPDGDVLYINVKAQSRASSFYSGEGTNLIDKGEWKYEGMRIVFYWENGYKDVLVKTSEQYLHYTFPPDASPDVIDSGGIIARRLQKERIGSLQVPGGVDVPAGAGGGPPVPPNRSEYIGFWEEFSNQGETSYLFLKRGGKAARATPGRKSTDVDTGQWMVDGRDAYVVWADGSRDLISKNEKDFTLRGSVGSGREFSTTLRHTDASTARNYFNLLAGQAATADDLIGYWAMQDLHGDTYYIEVAHWSQATRFIEAEGIGISKESGRWTMLGDGVHITWEDNTQNTLRLTPQGIKLASYSPGAPITGIPLTEAPADLASINSFEEFEDAARDRIIEEKRAQLAILRAAEEAKLKAQEVARLKVEEEKRSRALAEARQKAEEETRRLAEEDARNKAQELANQKDVEYKKRLAEEKARQREEELERKRVLAEEKRLAREEDRRMAKERDRLKSEEEAKRKEENRLRKLADLEAQRKAKEEEARRLADIEAHRTAQEREARRLANLEAQRNAQEEEARRLAELETQRKTEEEQRRLAQEQEARRLAELETQRKAKEEEAQRLAGLDAQRKAAEKETPPPAVAQLPRPQSPPTPPAQIPPSVPRVGSKISAGAEVWQVADTDRDPFKIVLNKDGSALSTWAKSLTGRKGQTGRWNDVKSGKQIDWADGSTYVIASTKKGYKLRSYSSSNTAGTTGRTVSDAQESTASGIVLWDVVFGDEFDGATIDESKWNTQFPWSQIINNEQGGYNPENVSVVDGKLVLTATDDTMTYGGEELGYTTGAINTYNKFEQAYGYFEIRAKVPEGRGLWPAFWLFTRNGPPEIDVLDVLSGEPDNAHFNTITLDANGETSKQTASHKGIDFSRSFRTVGVEWSPSEIIYYINGKEMARFTNNIPDQPMFLIASLAVGGDWPGPVSGWTAFPARMEIDFIRVYKRR